MKILFYSTNSNYFDIDNFIITCIPEWKDTFKQLKNEYSDCEFVVFTQVPGMFLIDNEYLNSSMTSLKNIENQKYTFFEDNSHKTYLTKTADFDEIIDLIISEKPDIAIATSFWVTPFDWLPVKDALVAEKLRENGIRTICHSVNTTLICFNKYETHQFLVKNNLNTAKAIYINHDLYFCANSKKEVIENVYKSAIQSEIKKMNFPLIVKDTVGLSSYGMQIIKTFGEAKAYLNSKKNNSDRIIEEYISGVQFGCEIHGKPGSYDIFPPFVFSVNQYGITSPKQSIKYGPILDTKKYKLDELNEQLKKLAELMQFEGIAQVDLVFDGKKWFIIEINPRLSGMSTTYSVSRNENFYKMILKAFLNDFNKNLKEDEQKSIPYDYTLNIKFPILDEKKINQLYQYPGVKYICQTEDKAAKQDREMGYCEVIISAKTKKELLKIIENIKKDFPEIIEKSFFEKAENIIKNN